MDNVNVEEKWKQTGLLENAANPNAVAHLLESISSAIGDILESDKMETEHVRYMSMTSFPIIARALNDVTFSIVENVKSSHCATVFVKEVQTEDEMLNECTSAAVELNAYFLKLSGVNVTGVRLSQYDKGYHIGIDYGTVEWV